MSTIKTDNIIWKTGEATANSQYTVTADKVVWGLARSWLKFNGSGSTTVIGSYNISSVTYVGTGRYKANLTNALQDANHSGLATAQGYPAVLDGGFTQTSSAVQFYVFYASSTGGGQALYDANPVTFALFR